MEKIKIMNKKDLKFALELAKKEGWNPGLLDYKSFFEADHKGFFKLRKNEEDIGCISAVKYDERYAFLGLFIIAKEHRGKGYGKKLWDYTMKHLSEYNVGLDAVIGRIPSYEESGFVFCHKNCRYEGFIHSDIFRFKNIVNVGVTNLKTVFDYDYKYFGAHRQNFLRSWVEYSYKSKIYVESGNVLGLGIIRKCYDGYKIGPLYAENFEIAQKLFLSLCQGINDKIILDIAEINADANQLVQKYNMKKSFETARMYNKYSQDVNWANIYGITTFELG